MNGIWKGTLLGLLNVFVIAVGMAALDHEAGLHFAPGVATLVLLFGSLPGVIGGAVLGAAAQIVDHWPRLPRIALLALPAIGLVFLLAKEFDMMQLAYVSCIPTIVAALVLERWTRKPAEPPPVPVARAVS